MQQVAKSECVCVCACFREVAMNSDWEVVGGHE